MVAPVTDAAGDIADAATFKLCRNDPVGREAGEYGMCTQMLYSAIYAHKATGSADTWAAAKKGYDYICNTFTRKRYRKILDQTVRDVFAYEEPGR